MINGQSYPLQTRVNVEPRSTICQYVARFQMSWRNRHLGAWAALYSTPKRVYSVGRYLLTCYLHSLDKLTKTARPTWFVECYNGKLWKSNAQIYHGQEILTDKRNLWVARIRCWPSWRHIFLLNHARWWSRYKTSVSCNATYCQTSHVVDKTAWNGKIDGLTRLQ